MSRTEFRDELQKPLAQMLKKQKLWQIGRDDRPRHHQPARAAWKGRPVESKIRYAVLCYGVPLRIGKDPTLKEAGLDRLRPELRRDEAAVDSELALLPLIEEKLPLAGPLRNPFYTTTNAAMLHPTNGVLLVTRLDGPTPAHRARPGGQGAAGRSGRPLGARLLRPAKHHGARLQAGGRLDSRRGGDLPAAGLRNGGGRESRHLPGRLSHEPDRLYIGWYDGNVSGPFTQPEVEFMPGAFAYHLHSYSAATLRSTNQHWVGPLLAKGATTTMGCVDEPYLSGTPDMAVFTARLIFHRLHLWRGGLCGAAGVVLADDRGGRPSLSSLREQPGPPASGTGGARQQAGGMVLAAPGDLNLAAGKPMAELVALLEQLETTRHSAVLTEKLGDLYAAQGKPSSAVHKYRQALQLDPSPQQRVRLLLTLGRKAGSRWSASRKPMKITRSCCKSSRITRISSPFTASSWPWRRSWARKPMRSNTRPRLAAFRRRRHQPLPQNLASYLDLQGGGSVLK